MWFTTPPHAAGIVDLVVTNPDGETGSLPGGFTYASPDALDFNGTWDGYRVNTEEIIVTFTIESNFLTRASCGASTSVAVSPAAVVNGAFSASGADGLRLSGRIVSPGQSSGEMQIPSCGATAWSAFKR
jgi:hypothetical protein